jgi:glycosyltransferase involved in cell wall biosynthesis
MRVLYLSQYFAPEVGATQTRAHEMATGLIRAGHDVTMLTEVPNHPKGIIFPGYRRKLWVRENLEGIDVVRVWVKASPVKTMRTRLAFYLTYMLNATLAGLALRGPYDVIYATSPPLFVGGAALALSGLRRIPLIFEVRDLWPESAVALNELHNLSFIRWATRLEEACYRRAKRIVVVTQGIRDRLITRGFGDKVLLIPNGANTDLFHYQSEAGKAIRQQLDLDDDFLIIYAGIHGIAQGLETVLNAAHKLRDHAGLHFLFIGDGPRKAELHALKERLALPNVTMLAAQPRETIPAYLSAADVALVPLRRLDIFRGALPSKIFDAWACECPIILSMQGEAQQVLQQANAGVYVEPESPSALAQVVQEMINHSKLLRRYGRNGRRFVEEHYSRQAQAQRLTRLLESLVP